MKHIRNFSIIAHIDHGKSTLADRFIEHCGAVSAREMEAQLLDSMALERERGITIKAQSVSLQYQLTETEHYQLNIIDTPGHVDFSYEVSRSLAACEGALLVIDAAQGVQAQSVANSITAIEHELTILPVLNKIDLTTARPEQVITEIEQVIGIDASDTAKISAKANIGIATLLKKIVTQIPPPTGDPEAPLKALIIDSWFDNYLGVVSLVRIVDGQLACKDKIKMMSTGNSFTVEQLGIFTPKRTAKQVLKTGEVGYIVANIKAIDSALVGDTVTFAKNPAAAALPGFETIKPRVFSGLFPADTNDYAALRKALAKLRLNDAALHYEPETSEALGFGFRCGFLGMLHSDIIAERLAREYQLALITTAPTVVYQLCTQNDELIQLDNPAQLPPVNQLKEIREPIIIADILLPTTYLGSVISLCIEKRGVQKNLAYIGKQVSLSFALPLNEVVLDFFDRLKSVSRGYASFDYRFSHFQAADLVKLDILINHRRVDALSCIMHRSVAHSYGRELTEKIAELIPRQMYEVAVQATIGTKILARQNVKAMRKNVTAKCYGGDISRKRKLLEKQKAGKKKMKQIGEVDIPQAAFMAILQIGKGK